MEEGRSDFRILTGTPTGKRILGRPRRIWEDNVRMDVKETDVNAGNWVDSDQDRDCWRALGNATNCLIYFYPGPAKRVLPPAVRVL